MKGKLCTESKFYLFNLHAQIMMKQFWLWPIVGGTAFPKLRLRMRITALWHDFRTPLCGFHCPPSLKPKTLAIFPLVHCTPPPPGLCTPGPDKLVRKRGGWIGSLSIPTEQKVNDGRFGAVDSGEKNLWNRKLLTKVAT